MSFNYNTEKPNILKDINLTVKSGDLVEGIGQSGEGKSTLIDLILGLLKPTKGSIIINEYDNYIIQAHGKIKLVMFLKIF